jgi:hypothetical protein
MFVGELGDVFREASSWRVVGCAFLKFWFRHKILFEFAIGRNQPAVSQVEQSKRENRFQPGFRGAIDAAQQSRNQSEKHGIHRRGTEYAEILVSKNSLRVLRASVVNIFLFWKSYFGNYKLSISLGKLRSIVRQSSRSRKTLKESSSVCAGFQAVNLLYKMFPCRTGKYLAPAVEKFRS